ncbi:hypothetical protein TELCIR_08707, partial [Teladorsagia circumcincta]
IMDHFNNPIFRYIPKTQDRSTKGVARHQVTSHAKEKLSPGSGDIGRQRVEGQNISGDVSLARLLAAADLMRYESKLRDVLKLRHAGDLQYVEEQDLTGIGKLFFAYKYYGV